MSCVKSKKQLKSFRFDNSTRQNINLISQDCNLNHTELFEFGLEFIKEYKGMFKDFIDLKNNEDKMKEVS